MADDNTVAISFSASTDDALAGIAQVRDALAGLATSIANMGGSVAQLGETIGTALQPDEIAQCTNNFAEMGSAAARDVSEIKAIGAAQSATGAAIASNVAAIQQQVQEAIAAYQKLNAQPVNKSAGNALRSQMEQYQELVRTARETYGTTSKLAEDAFSQTKEHLAAELKQGQITYDQETAQLLAALAQRVSAQTAALRQEHAAEAAALADKAKLYQRGTQAYKKALGDQEAADKKYHDDLAKLESKWKGEHQKIVDDAATHEEQEWKSVADQISGAFNSQLLKMLQGKESWAQASKKIEQDLVLKFLEDQVKMSAEFIANAARQLATWIATQTGMTAATTAGAAVRSAAEVASGQTSILQVVANALKAIFAGAGQTAAGVSAAVAPEAGPAAPAIGAAAGAAVVAEATGMIYDVGTNYVVRGGLALIHPGETIIPAGVQRAVGSGPYTGARGGGGSGGGDVHFHISTPNTRDMARALLDNNSAVMKAVQRAVKNGAHLRPNMALA